MAAKPVVNGIEKQLGPKRLHIIRMDVSTKEGRRIAGRIGLDVVPTIVGYDGLGNERWRFERVPKRLELWAKVITL